MIAVVREWMRLKPCCVLNWNWRSCCRTTLSSKSKNKKKKKRNNKRQSSSTNYNNNRKTSDHMGPDSGGVEHLFVPRLYSERAPTTKKFLFALVIVLIGPMCPPRRCTSIRRSRANVPIWEVKVLRPTLKRVMKFLAPGVANGSNALSYMSFVAAIITLGKL